MTFVAFGLSFSHHITVTLVASFLSFLAALLTLIAFAIDIALLALVRNEMGGFSGVTSRTNPGPGVYLFFFSFFFTHRVATRSRLACTISPESSDYNFRTFFWVAECAMAVSFDSRMIILNVMEGAFISPLFKITFDPYAFPNVHFTLPFPYTRSLRHIFRSHIEGPLDLVL